MDLLHYLKMKFPHYNQLEQKDCGAACLKMVAKYYGRIIDLQYLRDLCGSSREGVSILSISQAAETIGLRTMVFEVSFEQLFKKVTLPCIIHWKQKHFVVVYKIGKRKIWVSDPARSRITYTHEEFKESWIGTSARKKGFVIALEPQAYFDTLNQNTSSRKQLTYFQTIYKYLRLYKKQLGYLAVVMLVVTALQAVLPFIFRAVVDVGVGRNDLDFVNIILVANIALILSVAIGNFIRDWIIKHIGARFSVALISDYIIKLMRMPLQYFESRMIGDTLNRVRDHERIKNFVLNHSINLSFAILSFLIFSIILLQFNFYLFLIFISGTSLYVLWVLFFVHFQEKLDWDYHEINVQNQGYWMETLSSISEIKINNHEQKRRWKWERIQASLYHLNQKVLQVNHVQALGGQLINGLKNVFLTFYSAKSVLNGDMTLGVMISLQFIIGFLNVPIQQFIAFIQAYTSAKVSFLRLNDIHSLDDEERHNKPANFTLSKDKSIHIKGLFFRYSNEDTFFIRNVSMVIPEGKVTAIVGMSGSGKTTMLKILLRLYQPIEGDIFVGGMNITNFPLRRWRSHCAAVLQEGRIFNDTVLNNIVMDSEPIDYDRVQEVVVLTRLRDVIDSMPLGYHTRVGEKGRGLSQGQKQRILIARALYRDPDYLFLDEATNALDSINEHEILEALHEIYKNRTVVVVAHRLSTVRDADQKRELLWDEVPMSCY